MTDRNCLAGARDPLARLAQDGVAGASATLLNNGHILSPRKGETYPATIIVRGFS